MTLKLGRVAGTAAAGNDDRIVNSQAMSRTLVTAAVSASVQSIYVADTTSGAFNVTLPLAANGKGRVVVMWNGGTNPPSVVCQGSDKFDIATGPTTDTFSVYVNCKTYESDGSSMWVRTSNLNAVDALTVYNVVGSSTTAVVNGWYRVDTTSTSAGTITMPSGGIPAGALVIIENIGTTASAAINVVRGGLDNIDGTATPFALLPGERADLVYRGGTWYSRRHLVGSTANTTVARDSAGRAQVADPAVAQDIATKNYVDTVRVDVGTSTTGATLVANTWTRVTAGTTQAYTLPSAPVEATIVCLENLSGSAATITYVRGGTDTIEGVTTAFTLQVGERVTLTYQASGAQWFQARELWSSTAGTTMRRDSAGRAQVVDPVANQDVASKLYVDAKQSSWMPEDYGLLAWAYDPDVAINTTTLTPAGTLFMTRLKIRKPMTITNVIINVVTAGVTLTANQCFAALYNSSLGLLSATANQATNWASTGVKVMALSAAQAVAAGDYFVGFYYNGTTGPTLSRAASSTVVNLSQTAAQSRNATSSTGLTTAMPAPAAALVANFNSFWVGVS